MKKTLLILFISIIYIQLSAQSLYTISGTIKDYNTNNPVTDAAVSIHNTNIGTFSDSTGYFELCHLKAKEYSLQINHMSYQNYTIFIELKSDTVIDPLLKEKSIELKETIISVATVRYSTWDNPTTNFSELLNTAPEATTMNIGANGSKPVVRGLSFNRIAINNRGITQQNQQWGADHGTEINQFDIDKAIIHKGAGSLLLNSGNLTTIEIIPQGFQNKKEFLAGEAALWGASNNDELGGMFNTQWQKGKWYVRGSASYKDYADYRIPTEKINFDSEDITFDDKRVPNTAGREQSVSGTIGFKEKNITSYLNISNNYSKTGLYEVEHNDEHGYEHEESEEHKEDTSHRNIGMPYATSNHFTITNNTEWKTSSLRLLVNTGYQNNHRNEFEHFHEHYEGQAEPETDDDIAVDFKLKTYSTNARLYLDEKKEWKKTIGASIEYQQNRVSGFEFFLPRYNQISGGLSYVNDFRVSNNLSLHAGLRYDFGNLDITGYYDSALAQHLEDEGFPSQTVQEYAQRAYDVNRDFGGFSGNMGVNYTHTKELTLNFELGKTYRFPSANELAANGLHHAAFRYEIGNPDLKPEHGYTLDMNASYHNNEYNLTLSFNPFINYYSNYIYLQTVTDTPVVLYDDQPYKYMQTKAIYGGGEYNISYRPIANWELSSLGGFVLNKDLDNKKSLPFTPPFTIKNKVEFMKNIHHSNLSYYHLSVGHEWYANQNSVGTGEEKTPGTNLFNINGGFDYKFSSRCKIIFNVQVQNIFNTCYLNHLSLYRRLNIPQPGRNIQVFVRIPFGG